MKTHGCVRAVLLICCCGFSAACNQRSGLDWAMQRYADSNKPAENGDQPSQHISEHQSPAKLPGMQRDKQVAEQVQRYIGDVPAKAEPPPASLPRMEAAHRQPEPAPQARRNSQIGSMGSASLASVDFSSGSGPTLPVITSVTVTAASAQREPELPTMLAAANTGLQPMQTLRCSSVRRTRYSGVRPF